MYSMKNRIKTKRTPIPIKWIDVRYEKLKINYIRLQQGILHLSQTPGGKCDQQRRLMNPDRLTLQRFILRSYSEAQVHPDNYFPANR